MLILALCLTLFQDAAEESPLQVPSGNQPLPFATAQVSASGTTVAILTGGTVLHFAEKIDGKTVARPVFIPNIPGRKPVKQPYTVCVQVTKTVKDKDGKERKITEMILEEQIRTTLVGQGPISGQKPTLSTLSECKFVDLENKPVKTDEVVRRLRKRSPILVRTSKDMKLSPCFRVALNPKMMIVTLPMPKQAKKTTSRE